MISTVIAISIPFTLRERPNIAIISDISKIAHENNPFLEVKPMTGRIRSELARLYVHHRLESSLYRKLQLSYPNQSPLYMEGMREFAYHKRMASIFSEQYIAH